ncbi:MAG: Maf family protein [Candidatus Acidiferrales bacterium]
MKLILASGSPRRAQILRDAGFVFETIPTDADETRHTGEAAEAYVKRIATAKASAAQKLLEKANQRPIVIAADTVVLVGGETLLKPKDADDARRMLRMLSGGFHEILTGLAILNLPDGTETFCVEKTRVEFLPLSEDHIENYLNTGEPFDKAGAYGIQAIGGRFVARIDGCYFNVMGLPLSRVWTELRKHGFKDDKPR